MPSVTTAFTKQYEAEVHVAYQRMGSKLRGTIRTKSGIIGTSTTFQKVGKGVAGTKTRHGVVPVMNVDHSNVECTLYDYYAGDWQDKLDDLKTNIDEHRVIVEAGAYALGRKTDELIVAVAETTSNAIGDATTGLTRKMALDLQDAFGNADVPDDGNRYAIVGWHQWGELMNIDEFSSSDFVGADQLPWPSGGQGKRWLGFLWMPFSGLTLSGSERKCLAYHKSALGHGIGAEITADITWHGDHAAWFINHWMSQGACLIDATGCYRLRCKDDTAHT
jgi:hypothetical protein